MRMRGSRMMTTFFGVCAFVAAGMLPAPVDAQTPFVPYFGKNRVHYDRFEWHIYKTDHFEIFYYPSLEPHLARIASFAESAYQRISGELKHDLPDRVPLILFKTQSEFQSGQNITGSELPEGVLAFAEPERNRMVLPIDEPPDQLYRLITHELTHVFEFDIIPRGIMGASLPLWMDEGLANYMAGYWNVLDLMQVRDAALSDNVPKMSDFQAQPLSGRLPYSLGHATFEFIESKWGKEGLRQFLFSLRKSVIGGGESAYEEALKLKPEDFDEQFDRYLKERFQPFRDKERPADYGRNLALRLQKEKHEYVASALDRALALGRHDRGRRRQPQGPGARHRPVLGQGRPVHPQSHEGLRQGPRLRIHRARRAACAATWCRGSRGPRAAIGLRTSRAPRKPKTLIVQNVHQRPRRVPAAARQRGLPRIAGVQPGRPPGRLRGPARRGGGHLHDRRSTRARSRTSPTTRSPTTRRRSRPDGRSIVYAARISSNDKLFQLDLATGPEEAADVRRPRRHGGEVLRRPHAGVHLDGDADPPRRCRRKSRRNAQHPERLDAGPALRANCGSGRTPSRATSRPS